MRRKRAIVWFRNDLRLHDNEALVEAGQLADEVLPVYVFDERTFSGKTSFGFPKTGKYRTKFIIESIQNLRENFKHTYGIDLVVRRGITEDILADLAAEVKTSWIFCNRERTQEEVDVQDRLERRLWSIGQEMRYSRGKMLYYTADLPFPINQTPDIFTHFRKEVEKYVPIREPLDKPAALVGIPEVDSGSIPTLEEFGWEDFETDERSAFPYRGGESAAREHLNHYIWESRLLATYKKTRNGLIGTDFSSKLSPWLAQGCISPKYVYWEVKRFEEEVTKNKSTYWLIFELMWRDFFRFMAKKHGNKIFQLQGIKAEPFNIANTNRRIFNKWAHGRTGNAFVDANMREINATGYMSNRGRQNVASYLVKDLGINWVMGAEYFESLLIDYDPCSNYGNWNYVAGVGSDPRPNRYFNTLSQARRYDAHGNYAKLWLPELSDLSGDEIYSGEQHVYELV